MRHVIVGTAGHIDHGKSSLVKALTGIDPDRLKEEQLRGITIDLGFGHLELEGVQVGFVDVPGHEKFVKNMLAGVGGIDCVLLVIAADESIMPQTREHFDICRLLGIQWGIVAITKIDLVEPELVDLVREELAEAVRGSFLDTAEVIPVSSRTGEGLEKLKEAIRRVSLSLPGRPTDRLLRMPIDRAFTMRGFGTVVTGTMSSGRIHRDEEVELLPGSRISKVRGIQVHGHPTDRAEAGQRTAVNLQGLDLSQVERGMCLTAPHLFQATQLLDARLELLPGARPLRSFSKVRFHQGTSEVLARVAILGQSVLEPGEEAYAQLRLDAPALCLMGDPFIIRQFSPATTIGGGRILHPGPPKHRVTDRHAPALLQKMESTSASTRMAGLITMHPRQVTDIRELIACTGLPEAELKGITAAAVKAGELVEVTGPVPLLVIPGVIATLQGNTVALVARFHQEHPLVRGISREELRNRVFEGMPPEVFRFVLEKLTEAKRIAVVEDMIALHGREVQLSPAELRIQEGIEAILRKAAWQPPSLTDLSGMVPGDPEEIRKIRFWMLKERILIRISEDLIYHRETLEEMKKKIRARYSAGARFGVAEFKELFDLTRKHAIPLLEYLDRERVTRRLGSERILL
ncbi:MAG: selenocysteine-specific translation elongation factor SelB [Acidobacteria bacterium]|jgi:selenocysteine-specific elongation factor|nr:selenocysteine-specific translation elongation factor SelB [Acidobacteriota bacterium]